MFNKIQIHPFFDLYYTKNNTIDEIYFKNLLDVLLPYFFEKNKMKKWKIFLIYTKKDFIIEIKYTSIFFLKNKVTENELAFLISRYFYICMEEEKSFPIHSTLISKNNKNILIAGYPKSGKTTIALTMNKFLNYKIYSSNITILKMFKDSLFAIASTKVNTIRPHLFKILNIKNINNKNPFRLEKYNEIVLPKYNLKIDYIFFINIWNSDTLKINPIKDPIYIYNYLSYAHQKTLFSNINYISRDFNTSKNILSRFNFCKKLSNTPIIELAGSLNDIMEYIDKNIN